MTTPPMSLRMAVSSLESLISPNVGGLAARLRYSYRVVRQDWPKLSLLRDRGVDCHIATMQQSGTHWLTHMLAVALAEAYDVPEPGDIDDRSLIGNRKHPAVYSHVPRIIQTHNIPSPLCHSAPLRRLLRFPKYIILLRDMRASLVSHYEKHHARRMTFADYLRNDRLVGNPVRWDVWYRIRFLNAWRREIGRLPAEQTLVVCYEALQADPLRELQRVWSFLDLPEKEGLLARAIERSTKERMAKKETTAKPAKVIRKSSRHPFEWFTEDDRNYFTEVCRAFLKHHFDYDYTRWDTLGPASLTQTSRAA